MQPIVAERALLGESRDRVDVDDAERAGRNTVPAAVAGVGLNHDRIKLGAHDRAGRTNFEASRMHAVLAHVAHQQPAAVLAVFGELLDKFYMAPVDAVELARVVVAVAAQGILPPLVLGS